MSAAIRCPYCLTDLERGGDDDVVGCAACAVLHHRACFLEHGRCTIFGCGSTDLQSGAQAPVFAMGSLHPFLPVEQGLVKRCASFLSVRVGERNRRKRRGVGHSLTLALPETAVLGGLLEGVIHGFTPRQIKGQGLRLTVSAVLEVGGKGLLLGRAEAVVIGKARTSWLSQLKLWSRQEAETLLLPGETPFAFSFDPTPLAWNGALPLGMAGLGPCLFLDIHAELDAVRRTRTPVQRVWLLDSRPSPVALGEEDGLVLYQRVSPPELGREPRRRWEARPITTRSRSAAEVRPCAQFAVRHRILSAQAPPPKADTLDLTLQRPPGRGGFLRGTVEFHLRRPRLAGRLVLEFVVERRGLKKGTRAWRAYAREAGILCDHSPDGASLPHRHAFEFEYPLPPSAFGGKPKEQRRVRIRAVLLGEGSPLRSLERTVRMDGKPKPPAHIEIRLDP